MDFYKITLFGSGLDFGAILVDFVSIWGSLGESKVTKIELKNRSKNRSKKGGYFFCVWGAKKCHAYAGGNAVGVFSVLEGRSPPYMWGGPLGLHSRFRSDESCTLDFQDFQDWTSRLDFWTSRLDFWTSRLDFLDFLASWGDFWGHLGSNAGKN